MKTKISKRKQWEAKWRECHEKAMEHLDACGDGTLWNWDEWNLYKKYSKEADHAFSVMLRCKSTVR